MRVLHIIAGLAGLVSGAVALFALKGGRLHRKSGMVFVYTMLFMSASGAAMAVRNVQRISVVAGILTFYLVITALLTVRRPLQGSRWTDAAAAAVALATAAAGTALGFMALASPTGRIDGLPAAPAFMFAVVGFLAAIGDLRLVRAGGIQGPRRLARHLWRMCFALYIATASFFLGQPQVFPEAVRRSGALGLPVLLVVLLMVYWLVRVRWMRRLPRPSPIH